MKQVPSELWPVVYRLATSDDWPPRSDAGIAAFFDFSIQQNLLPLLMEEMDLPDEFVAEKYRFRALQALNRKCFELSRDAALEFARIVGIDAFLFMKGSDYRHRLYERPEFRQMRDLDVYVPSSAIPGVLEKLASAGYPRKYCAYGAALTDRHYEISLEVKGVHVEIHRGFMQRVRASVDYEAIWRRREPFERDGIRGYRMAMADAMIGQALSLAKDEFSSELNRYVDFALLLRYQDQLPYCVQRAQEWGIERPLFGALHLTTTLFPSVRTAATDETIDCLLDARTRAFLVRRVLPDRVSEPSGHVTRRRLQLWRKYWLMDRHWRRFAFLVFHAYQTVVGWATEWHMRRKGLLPRPRLTPGRGMG